MSTLHTTRATQSDRLLDVLAEFDQFLVVMHDNPDPDAIASGWGVQVLIEERLRKPARVVGRGAVLRAENQYMVQLLQPPIELVEDVEITANTATILVDCSSEATNHLLVEALAPPIAVIDHHTSLSAKRPALYEDIRPEAAASASIVASYLRQQRLAPGAKLATAMLYAIRTETQGYETHHSSLDRSILPWLTERAEPELMAEIENAPLPRSYFGEVVLALQSAVIHGDCAFCQLPCASGAEIIAEVADLLIRCEGIRRVLCEALVGEDILLSARTKKGSGSATELVTTTLDGIGQGGGHAHRAGGKIAGARNGARLAEPAHDNLRRRWLTACGAIHHRGTRLVAKSEIIEHLL